MSGASIASVLFTVGQEFSNFNGESYTPPGLLDGLGAFMKDKNTVRILAAHELSYYKGYPYEVKDSSGGTFMLTGARASYFDIDTVTMKVLESGMAYDTIYDCNGNMPADAESVLPDLNNEGANGIERFCSAKLVDAGTYGFTDSIFFLNEETGGDEAPFGGNCFALDVQGRALHVVPALGRGAW